MTLARLGARRCRLSAAAKWRFGRHAPAGARPSNPRAGPAGQRLPMAASALLSAMKQMQKSHPRVAFFTFEFLAERGGFEPPVGYEPTHAFQACDLNHSSISPDGFSRRLAREAAYYNKLSRLHKSILASAPRPLPCPRLQHQPAKTTRLGNVVVSEHQHHAFPPQLTPTMILFPR